MGDACPIGERAAAEVTRALPDGTYGLAEDVPCLTREVTLRELVEIILERRNSRAQE